MRLRYAARDHSASRAAIRALSTSMPSARRRSHSRKARRDGMRISSTSGRRGVAWIAVTSWDICSANGFPGSSVPGSSTRKQKSVILHAAARKRRVGEQGPTPGSRKPARSLYVRRRRRPPLASAHPFWVGFPSLRRTPGPAAALRRFRRQAIPRPTPAMPCRCPLRRRAPPGKSTTFPIAMLNSNKRAITLSLKHERGRALLFRMPSVAMSCSRISRPGLWTGSASGEVL